MPIELKKNMTILFQGDSITDCGRMDSFLDSMGSGYAYFVSSTLNARYPELNLTFINRGISGNCVDDLSGRWQRDCLDLKPHVVSILVGVNDTWRYCTYDSFASSDLFEKEYRKILTKTRRACNPILILCEPFLLDISDEIEGYRHELAKRIDIVKKLVDDFDAMYVPFDTLFTEASKNVDPSYWAPDGVHPTPAGHAFMAEKWLSYVVGER